MYPYIAFVDITVWEKITYSTQCKRPVCEHRL